MKTNKKNLLLVIILMVTFLGCKKYEDGPSFSPWPKRWRVDNTWKIDKIVVGSYSQTVSGNTTYQYKNNGDYIETNGSSSVNGTWEFGDKKESIKVTVGNLTNESKILRLTSKELWTTDDNGTTVTQFVSAK